MKYILESEDTVVDVLGVILDTYFDDSEFQECMTIESIFTLYSNEEYEVKKIIKMPSYLVAYETTLPDGSYIIVQQQTESKYSMFADPYYHLQYVLSRFSLDKMYEWMVWSRNVKYREVAYHDLIKVDGVGHIPAPLYLEEFGYERMLQIPVSKTVRDIDYFKCPNCGTASFYHTHPCDVCGEGEEKYSDDEKIRLSETKSLEYIVSV